MKTEEFELIRAGKRDRSGNTFTREALEKVVEDFDPNVGVLVTSGFSRMTADVQGAVQSVRMDGDAVMALVKIYDTPQGLRVQQALDMQEETRKSGHDGVIGVELAAGGRIDCKDVEVESEPATDEENKARGHAGERRTIKRFDFTMAAFVPSGEKIK